MLPETSAAPGRFRPWQYQRGIADAITDPEIETVTWMKAARVGYTTLLNHTIGYFLEHEPSPILLVQPRADDAKDYSKDEIAPMLRDIDVLAEIAGDPKNKTGGQTILYKAMLNGGSLRMVGANSPGGFRRVTVRVVLFDEVDGYPAGGAGAEGDQIALGTKRSESYWNRKIILGSTPTLKGISRIEKSYEESDQRHYFVPCPHCGHKQVLEWGGPDTAHGIKWRRDAQGNSLPETAYYLCASGNGCVIEELDKEGMIAGGEWRASRPFKRHAGFHLSALYSLQANATWANLASKWVAARGDPIQRQTFVNLELGLPYEDQGDGALNEITLLARREAWPGEVPRQVAVLTAGVDVQDDRVEIEIVGWGADEESWSLAYEIIEGDTQQAATWDLVDEFLKRKWRRADNREFELMAVCVDSGGHATQQVYRFARARLGRKIWAIKGESARGGERNPVWPVKRNPARNKAAFRPFIIGVNAAKDSFRQRLHIDPSGAGPHPGACHFPLETDINSFAQMVSERLVVKSVSGVRHRAWELMAGRANERLDCRVYAYAALCGLLHFGLQLNRRAAEIRLTYVGPLASDTAPAPAETPPTPAWQGPNFTEGVTITTAEPKRSRFGGRLAGA